AEYQSLQEQDFASRTSNLWQNYFATEGSFVTDIAYEAVTELVGAHNLAAGVGNEVLTWQEYRALNPSKALDIILDSLGYKRHYEARFFDGFTKTILLPAAPTVD